MSRRAQAIRLFEKYNREAPWASGSTGPATVWLHKSMIKMPYIHALKVGSDTWSMRRVYTLYGVILLRHYNKERKLVIGCGNKPIYFGATPLRQRCTKERIPRYWRGYATAHSHEHCYTINPDIGMNPSIVGRFGIQDMTFLPSGAFRVIELEGFMTDVHIRNGRYVTDNVCTIRDILHLLSDGGVVTSKRSSVSEAVFIKRDGALVSIADPSISLHCDSPSQYHAFHECMLKSTPLGK